MYKIPRLKYGYRDLEPFINGLTMYTHHTKDHKKYADDANAALQRMPFVESPDEARSVSASLAFNLGGFLNHSMFFSPLGPSEPSGELRRQVENGFGSYRNFVDVFTQTAMAVRGSGWAVFSADPDGQLIITQGFNQEHVGVPFIKTYCNL